MSHDHTLYATILSMLIGAIVGGTGALLSFWAGWRARGDVIRVRGRVIGRPPPIFNEGHTQRGNRRGSNPPPPGTKPQPPGGRVIGPDGVPIGYRPNPSRFDANPPPREP